MRGLGSNSLQSPGPGQSPIEGLSESEFGVPHELRGVAHSRPALSPPTVQEMRLLLLFILLANSTELVS